MICFENEPFGQVARFLEETSVGGGEKRNLMDC